MYARGMTVREIQGFLLDQYKVEIGADFISTVTDSVLEAVVDTTGVAAVAMPRAEVAAAVATSAAASKTARLSPKLAFRAPL